MAEKGIATQADVLEYEKIPIDQRLKAFNTYDLIKYGASLDPDALALSLILSGEHYAEPIQALCGAHSGQLPRPSGQHHSLRQPFP
jgi:fatty-acyl-CoA synthase